jgi:putative ABC transport system permease protein
MGLRLLAREWRSGELGVLLLALAVAVAALSGVGLLVDRVNRAMLLQASEVLGADLRLQSPRPIDAGYAQQAEAAGLQTSATTALLSVVLRGDATQLANVYAVAAGYPLRGTVRVSDQPFGEPSDVHTLPAAGEVWPDSRLLAALGANVGDSLSVGAATLRVTRVLVSRPDQGSGFVELAPTLLMNQTDLPSTELLQPGSRASHAALFAGTPQQTQAFSKWLAANKRDAERLRDLREASPEVGNAATRATRFLLLASLASVLLSAVAVAMSARRYVQRHLDVVALLKTLGASSRFALALSATQLLAIALMATALGSAVGYLAQSWLLRALQGLIETQLPPPGSGPLFMGLVAAVLLLAGFALPPVVQLSKVPAIRILRRDMAAPKAAAFLRHLELQVN